MQPTYLPWIGYFDLIDQSDKFVFLDSVQFNSRSWQQRNKIKSSNGMMQWLSVPALTKGRRHQKIDEVEIDPTQNFRDHHLKAINFSYANAPYFKIYYPGFSEILKQPESLLGNLTINLIQWVCETLGIQTPFIRSSSFNPLGTKVDLLINVCKHEEADHYFSAAGSKEYIDQNNLFLDNQIQLSYHSYVHPTYQQLYGDFLPYLSVVDLLFNEGPNSLEIIRSGRKELETSNSATLL